MVQEYGESLPFGAMRENQQTPRAASAESGDGDESGQRTGIHRIAPL